MQINIAQRVQSYLKKSAPFKLLKRESRYRIFLEGLEGFPLAQAVAVFKQTLGNRIWVLSATEDEARQISRDLTFSSIDHLLLTTSGKQLYSQWEGSQREHQQLSLLGQILQAKTQIVVTSLRAFVSPVVSAKTLQGSLISIQKGDPFASTLLSEALVRAGYYRSPSTSMPGEFSLHGEVFDLFPFESDLPLRIFADWDQIERVAFYDPLTQDTVRSVKAFTMRLASDEELRSDGQIDQYFQEEDYFVFVGEERLASSFHSLEVEAKALFREAFTLDRSVAKPHELLFSFPDFYRQRERSATLLEVRGRQEGAYQFDITGARSFFGNFTLFKEELANLVESGYEVTIFAQGDNQRQRLEAMLHQFDGITIVGQEISSGFTIISEKIVAMCDHEIFGRRKQVAKTLYKTQSSPLDSFVELHEGDYVVHINYGVGRFLKIDRVTVSGKERDYIKIQYAQEETLFVPIEQANLVQRYVGSDGSSPRLDHLGGQGWENKKAKARKSAEELASRLIELYARRKASHGYPFPRDTDWQLEFEASFPFEETEDQLQCIEDVKQDMESPQIMDRLICGDVGYGKTEIAFRAAFKAVMAGKQVAFLAPTTLLAEQHFNTLQQRLGEFPLRTALLSRMVSKKEQQKSLKALAKGEVDILVGTHRILQKDVKFHDLGLLIIDEEQRFGVKDKERVKELKTNVDSLALSATPIPRTLYMSLLKIRDMSLLATPPLERRAIKTVIEGFDLDLVEKAIRFELQRQGQVFYLHNRIETLEKVVTLLQNRLPEVSIAAIHGRMEGSAIEEIMNLFVHQGIQVLVSTTIIENGIDIPNVNTIIIDRADLYGVSQLYQLRGRVGRSDREAYAYLLYPELKSLSEEALKRLKVLSEHTQLGSGFKIAMKDMEIRGTGNLLGREQSGQMASVGLDMYLKILDEVIAAKLKQEGEESEQQEVFLELDYAGFISDSYISEPTVKFEIYRKIASISNEAELQNLNAELADRFGTPPPEVSNLLYIAELKIICRKLGIYHLRERGGEVTIEFAKVKNIAIDKVMDLIQTGSVSLNPKRLNVLTLKTEAISLKDKSLFILEKLQRLL